MKRILVPILMLALALAGCAEETGDVAGEGGTPSGGEGAAPPKTALTQAEAAQFFGTGSGSLPDKYGLKMAMTKDGKDLLTADAAFEKAKNESYFQMTVDPEFAQRAGGGMGDDPLDGQTSFGIYGSPVVTAFVVNKTVTLMEPNDELGGDDGADPLMDPADLLEDLGEENVTIGTITPTTIRGKGAYKMDITVEDEDGPQNMTVYVFAEPRRLARIEMVAPSSGSGEGEPDPFAGATMSLDVLYDNEVKMQVPSEVRRALGLHYVSDAPPFMGADEETWTFQVDGGIALGEVVAEVRQGMDNDAPATWTMKLSDTTKTEGGVTLTFADVDADGKVSEGDTLQVVRTEGAYATVALRDTVTGYLVTPGGGLLAGLLALAGVALLAARRP